MFGAPENELVLRTSLLDTPMLRVDPGLCHILDRYSREMLDRLPRGETTSSRIAWCLAEALRGGGAPRETDIARKLGMGARDLQRRLMVEGTSYRSVLDSVRRNLAVGYLAEPRVTTAEVAFLLGFSEVSSFHRAFRRWTGMTPAAYGRKQASDRAPAAL